MKGNDGEGVNENHIFVGALLMNLIDEIRAKLMLEVRPNSLGSEYLEGVMDRKDLPLLLPLLEGVLGPGVKGPAEEANLPGEIQAWVEQLGGLRRGQSFFYRQERDRFTYVALWPWESNPNKVTLKCGVNESIQP